MPDSSEKSFCNWLARIRSDWPYRRRGCLASIGCTRSGAPLDANYCRATPAATRSIFVPLPRAAGSVAAALPPIVKTGGVCGRDAGRSILAVVRTEVRDADYHQSRWWGNSSDGVCKGGESRAPGAAPVTSRSNTTSSFLAIKCAGPQANSRSRHRFSLPFLSRIYRTKPVSSPRQTPGQSRGRHSF